MGVYNKYLSREWPQYIVGPDVEVVAFGQEHPVDAGIYFLFGADDRLLYIGQSLGIHYRMNQHYRAGKRFAYYGAVDVPTDLFRPVETAYIHALEPPWNKGFLRPEYRSEHDKMVAAIKEKWDAPSPGPAAAL